MPSSSLREPEIRPYDRVITKDAMSDDGVFTVHRIGDRVFYEIPKAHARQGVSLGQPDRQDDAGRRLRRPGRWATASSAGSGAATASCCAACLYDVVADRELSRSPARSRPRTTTPILMAFNVEAFGKDDAPVIDVDAALHHARCRSSAPRTRRAARERSTPAGRSSSAPCRSPTTSRSKPPTPSPRRPSCRTARPRRPPTPQRRRRCGPAARSVVHALQHGAAAREADDAAAVRRARRLLHACSRWTTASDEHRAPQRRYITRWRLEKKDPNAAISEPVKPIVYYVDPATPTKWVPVPQARHRELAAGVRGGRLQERDHREGSADAGAGSRLEPRGRALLGDPLAAVDDRERVGTAHSRSAHRRDSRVGHPVLPQRHEPGPRLVLRAGRPARSAREDAAAARRPDGPAARIRRRARGRPHARLPAQHEGQLDVSRRRSCATRSGSRRWATRRR